MLAIGAHPDDVELGCGATLARHIAAGHRVVVLVVADGARGSGADAQVRYREQSAAAAALGVELEWLGLPDGRAGDSPEQLIASIEQVVRRVHPVVVYTHSPHDSHQDHRATAQAAVSACRDVARLLHFESPSTTGFAPTVFTDVAGFVGAKLAALRAHASQVAHSRRVDLEAVEALMRYRGFQGGITYAESFVPFRFVWNVEQAEKSMADAAETWTEIAL
ncbi:MULTISPECIES: PIG-L deacetylase family protein [Microbacterium]|uniref:PIG-L deacetylase family protein n=1 Tax=Microbacterium TaxID=33882 RepID=UPI0013DF00B2|nr:MULTISPECIES: PIG-L deacetylase family protein [Microbacterium]